MNKFRPKKSSSRKVLTLGQNNMNASERAIEFGLDYQSAHMQLNEITYTFNTNNGIWSNGKIIFEICKKISSYIKIK